MQVTMEMPDLTADNATLEKNLAARRRLHTQMPYGFIILIASVALTGVYVFVADVSAWLKALFAGLLLVSFVWRYGLFLQAGLGVCLSLYFTYIKARYSEGEL